MSARVPDMSARVPDMSARVPDMSARVPDMSAKVPDMSAEVPAWIHGCRHSTEGKPLRAPKRAIKKILRIFYFFSCFFAPK
jgi:hypothetical protein